MDYSAAQKKGLTFRDPCPASHLSAPGRNPTFKLFEQNSACALAPADILSSRGRGFMGENDPVANLGVRPVRRGKGGFDLLLKCSDVLMFLL
jgi:hypothetical protein